MDKNLIRRKYLQKRLALSRKEVLAKSKKIAENLLNLPEILQKNNISCYLPIRNEVETKFIIEQLIKNGVNIFLPGFNKKRGEYFFAQFGGWKNLEEGLYGVLQPTDIERIDAKNIDVAILPGVAFSKDGVRLGYGKGVFDRLLTGSPALKIGLAYDFQIIDAVPCEKHDLVMDIIVSEKKVHRL